MPIIIESGVTSSGLMVQNDSMLVYNGGSTVDTTVSGRDPKINFQMLTGV